MSILKRQVNSVSNFASSFIVITQNSLVSFKLIHILLYIKGFNESPNFEDFVCFGENLPNSSCHFPNHKSVFLQILYHTLVSWNIAPLYSFSSVLMKICQILVIFEIKNKFFFKFCATLWYHETTPPYFFLAGTLYTFSKSSLSKYKSGEISPEQSKVWNFALWWAPFVKII